MWATSSKPHEYDPELGLRVGRICMTYCWMLAGFRTTNGSAPESLNPYWYPLKAGPVPKYVNVNGPARELSTTGVGTDVGVGVGDCDGVAVGIGCAGPRAVSVIVPPLLENAQAPWPS